MSRYDEIADWYADVFGDRIDDPATAAVLEALGDVAGQRICDLACGHGRVSRELVRRGARVLGIDFSSALISKAREREHEHPLGITYVCADASTSLDGEFDTIVCNLALPDIDDLDSALLVVAASLRPGGRFVASLPHPCFQGPDAECVPARDGLPAGRLVTSYFEEGRWLSREPGGVRGKVGANHRMISTYVNAIVRSGLLIEQLVEPRTPSPHLSGEPIPGYDQVPAFVVIVATR